MKEINWSDLPFSYYKTDYNVRSYYKDGQWSEPQLTDSEEVSVHMASTCLHYGQEIFEGLKAFRGRDGKARVFRWNDNARRMHKSALGVMMEPVPEELFGKALAMVIGANEAYIPPYGTGASLYIRPLLIGIGAMLGVKPSREFAFIIFVNPVGPYFRTGFNPCSIQIVRDFDRAAPLGTGNIKVGGNYAAGLYPTQRAMKEGFVSTLFLDSKEKKYIDECGPANFFAIKGNTYVTPESPSVLPSITNLSLIQLAKDMGMKVERRKILLSELRGFDEVGACGTATVISPISKIVDRETGDVYEYCKDGKAGPVSTKLYQTLQGIQMGDTPDIHHWTTIL